MERGNRHHHDDPLDRIADALELLVWLQLSRPAEATIPDDIGKKIEALTRKLRKSSDKLEAVTDANEPK